MRGGGRLRPVGLTALVATFTLAAGRAEAQFGARSGLGLGYGYGLYGGFGYRPASIDYLNQRSLQNASRATMGPTRYDYYANNPNAYINHLHDPGYLAGYDVATRREIEARIGRFSDGPPPSRMARRSRHVEPAEVRPSPQSVDPRPVGGVGGTTTGPRRPSRAADDDPPPAPTPARPPAAGYAGVDSNSIGDEQRCGSISECGGGRP